MVMEKHMENRQTNNVESLTLLEILLSRSTREKPTAAVRNPVTVCSAVSHPLYSVIIRPDLAKDLRREDEYKDDDLKCIRDIYLQPVLDETGNGEQQESKKAEKHIHVIAVSSLKDHYDNYYHTKKEVSHDKKRLLFELLPQRLFFPILLFSPRTVHMGKKNYQAIFFHPLQKLSTKKEMQYNHQLQGETDVRHGKKLH